MTEATGDALWLAVQLAGPPLLAMLLVGVVISVVQALTQIQESTLAFLPKLVVMGLVLALLGPGMGGALRGFAARMFDRVVAAGGGP